MASVEPEPNAEAREEFSPIPLDDAAPAPFEHDPEEKFVLSNFDPGPRLPDLDGPETRPSPGPPTDLVLDAVASLGESLGRRLDALNQAFDREIRAEATREKVVDRLHAELQEYKGDLLLGALRPVFVDLIQLHDDIGKMVAAQGPGADLSDDAARLLTLISGFQQGIEDILYRQGVEPFQADDDAFDPRRQRAFATVATDDPALNKRVAARLRRGFRSGDRTIRPEIVTVYALKK